MSFSRIVSGAKVVLYINGAPFAAVVSFRWDVATPAKEIRGLDSGEPYELAPGATKVLGNLLLVRQISDGGLEGAGVTPSLPNLPRGKYVSLALIERTSDTQLFRADQCWISSQSWDVPSRGLVTGSVSFEALNWNNEVAT